MLRKKGILTLCAKKRRRNGEQMVEYVAVDLETTGLSPYKAKIIEIGAVRYRDGQEREHFSMLLDPECAVPEKISLLTGIRQEMLAGMPKEEEALEAFLEFAGNSVLLGHNLRFDYSFLKYAFAKKHQSFERYGIDTLEIARKYLPELPGRSLPELCVYYGIDSGNSHRALDDARSAARLYERLKENFGESAAKPLVYPVKKPSPMTAAQKNYLNDLIKYHKIQSSVCYESMTKSEASRMIDRIILEYGKPAGHF